MRIIPLTQRQVALVDDADYPRLSVYKWYALKKRHTFYAVRMSPKPNRRPVYMHLEILGESPGLGYEVDHQDGMGINNQRANLRWLTNQQNHMNQRCTRGSSQYKGVYWSKRTKKWQAGIRINGKGLYLGRFPSEEDAARAYDTAALEYFGEYARLNLRS